MPAGLRWRLTAWVAAVLLVSAGVVFFVVYQDTGSQLQGQIDRDITGDTGQMLQTFHTSQGQSATRIAAAAERYVTAQPYSATSTMLFVLLPGGRVVSNHPEEFSGRGPDPGETPEEQADENAEGRTLLVPHLGYSTVHVPDVGRMRIVERRLDLGTVHVIAGAGEPLALVERAQHGVARAFVLPGAVVLVFALVASYLAGARVSAPLRRMAQVATRVDAGDLGPRMATTADRHDRCGFWLTRSITCSTGSRRRSRASANSWPTPRTSCARR